MSVDPAENKHSQHLPLRHLETHLLIDQVKTRSTSCPMYIRVNAMSMSVPRKSENKGGFTLHELMGVQCDNNQLIQSISCHWTQVDALMLNEFVFE